VYARRKGQWTITDALMSSDKTFLLYSSITPLVHVVPLPQNLNDVNPKGTADGGLRHRTVVATTVHSPPSLPIP
jgi:hypothetical protein